MDKMRVFVENLGAVNKCEIELKPLTIFVGANNTGKTWTAYTISSIFHKRSFNIYLNSYVNGTLEEKYPPLENVYNRIMSEGSAKIDLKDFFEKYYSEYVNNVAKLAPVWFSSFMATTKVKYDFKLNIKFDEQLSNYIRNILSVRHVDGIGAELLNVHKDAHSSVMYFYTKDANLKDNLPEAVIKRFIFGNILVMLQRSFFYDVVYFPPERTGGITIATAPRINKKGQLIKTPAQMTDAEYPGTILSDPIGEMLMFIDTMKNSKDRSNRDKKSNLTNEEKRYVELSQILQTQILSGNLEFSDPEPDGTSDILFKFGNKVTLDLSAASSTVRDLTQLALYLKYNVEPNELLVIDEPEMNLHPEAQVKLIEFLVMLVNAKLNVLMTTHSPYFIDHLTNLMKAYNCKDREAIKDKFYLKTTDAFISQKNVSIYLFDKGTCENILNSDGLVEWGTFSNVSERIASLYYEF